MTFDCGFPRIIDTSPKFGTTVLHVTETVDSFFSRERALSEGTAMLRATGRPNRCLFFALVTSTYGPTRIRLRIPSVCSISCDLISPVEILDKVSKLNKCVCTRSCHFITDIPLLAVVSDMRPQPDYRMISESGSDSGQVLMYQEFSAVAEDCSCPSFDTLRAFKRVPLP